MKRLLEAILKRSSHEQRCLIALAGPPGSGKSTLAQELSQRLPCSATVAMDGFHYDNAVLDQLGLRSRKGSPETFDYAGFAVTLRRIHDGEPNVAVPVFDRTMDLAPAGAALIPQSTKIILVEGNYLLLDEPPWNGLREYFHLAVFLDIPREELQRRLMKRWLDLGRTPEQAEHWVVSNDMPNVDRVLRGRSREDLSVRPGFEES